MLRRLFCTTATPPSESQICAQLLQEYRSARRPHAQPGPTWVGEVLHTRMSKTAVVGVPYYRLYKKYGREVGLRRVTKFKVHDETEQCRPGDIVQIHHSRPHSKTKHFEVLRMVQPNPSRVFLAENPKYLITQSRSSREKLARLLDEAERKGLSAEEIAHIRDNFHQNPPPA